jgi:hypothetical protein
VLADQGEAGLALIPLVPHRHPAGFCPRGLNSHITESSVQVISVPDSRYSFCPAWALFVPNPSVINQNRPLMIT